jgi:membrane-bound lytic murein transglycosylase A
VASSWSELPGWAGDRLVDWWPAFLAGCARPAPGWSGLCAEALLRPPASIEGDLRAWLQARVGVWRVEPLPGTMAGGADPAPVGLLTGYLEPVIAARRRASGEFQTPLYAPPADLAQRRPYWTRQELDALPAARAALRGREIAFVADPLDALFIQIQGSARLSLADDRPGGSPTAVRLAFAGHNDQPYRSVGRWLIEQGELRAGEASWPAIKAWAQRNPRRVQEMLWTNPRVVFFREEPLPDPSVGPRGAQGVALTPQRSIAVDPLSVPYGTPVWLDSTEPLSNTPLRRLTMAQDTGSAIVGAVRADYFWGWGAEAEAQAGRMRQGLRKWVLWPLPRPD